jgi:putative colanic acid biosynthesis acetyltransferase WcaF
MDDKNIWLHKSVSPYKLSEKIKMQIWWFVERIFFRLSFQKFKGWRNFLLKSFGAKIGNGVGVHPKARIWFPWNLEIGNNTGISFDVLIYNLDKVKIGNFSTISHRTHINTGTHDISDPDFKLITKPVNIGSGVFIGTDSYIGPGINIGNLVVVGARSVVLKDLPANMICYGHPCKPIKERVKK